MEELAGVLIAADVKNRTVTVTASNLDAFRIESITDVNVEREGVALVNAKRIKDVLGSITGDLVEVAFDSKLWLKSEGQKASLSTMAHVNFPVAPVVENRRPLVIDFASLNQIMCSIPTNTERLNLYGASIVQDGDSILALASNGRVVGRVKLNANGKVDAVLFIPAPVLPQIVSMGPVAVCQFGSWIAFESPSSTLLAKRSATEPMDIKSHLDKMSFNAKCTVAREDLLSLTRIAHSIRRDTDTMTTFKMTQGKSSLTLNASTISGAVNESIVVGTGGAWGDWKEANFPTDNFLAFLGPSESDVVKIHFSDPKTVIRLEDGAADLFVMPMRDK